MPKANKIDINFVFSDIEIIRFRLQPPARPGIKTEDFIFNVQINQKIDATNKLIQVFVEIDTLLNGEKNELANLSTLCVFSIADFDDVFKKPGKKMEMPDLFINTLSTIAISTTRGIMFSLFRGTYLHRAILPIVDPAQLRTQPV